MVVPMMMRPNRLSQILDAGKLAALGGIREVGGKLIQLIRCRGIPGRLGRLGCALKIRGDLLCNPLVLSWIRLLELLEVAQHLGKRGQLLAVGLQRNRGAERVHIRRIRC